VESYVRDWWARNREPGAYMDALFRDDFREVEAQFRFDLRTRPTPMLKRALHYLSKRLPPGGTIDVIREPQSETEALIYALGSLKDGVEDELADRGRKPPGTPQTSALDEGKGSGPKIGSTLGDKRQLDAQDFTHSPDYRAVTLRGKDFTLMSRQAQMIEFLDKARESGQPDVRFDYILEEMGTHVSRSQDTWRTSLEARKALIRTGTRKGTLRLNL
jgi:hypothetical protein